MCVFFLYKLDKKQEKREKYPQITKMKRNVDFNATRTMSMLCSYRKYTKILAGLWNVICRRCLDFSRVGISFMSVTLLLPLHGCNLICFELSSTTLYLFHCTTSQKKANNKSKLCVPKTEWYLWLEVPTWNRDWLLLQ